MANTIETDLIIEAISKGFDKVSKDIKGLGASSETAEKQVSKASKGIGAMDVALGNLASGALQMAGRAMVDFAKESVNVAMNMEETASLIDNSLGPAADSFRQKIEAMAEATNRSAIELEAGASTIIAMTRSMGLGQQAAADYSASMAQIATDLGSFFNKSTEDVFLDIQSALAGSSETLQKYGIDVRETALKQAALNMGLSDGKEVLDRVTRATVIQAEILRQASDAMGDAERTSDSASNTMRGLEAATLDLQAAIGQELIPVMYELTIAASGAIKALSATTSAKQAREELLSLGSQYKDLQKAISNTAAQMLKDNTIWEARRFEAQLLTEVLKLLDAGVEGTTEELIGYAQAAIAANTRAAAMNRTFEDQVVVTEEVAEAVEELTRLTAAQSRAIVSAYQENHTYEVSEEQVEGAIDKRTEAQEAEIEAMEEAAEAQRELTQRTADYFQAAIEAEKGAEGLAAIFEEVKTQSVFVSNATEQQTDDLKELQAQYTEAAETIHDYEVGVKGATLTDEERNEKIEEQRVLMAALEPHIASLIDLGGEYVTVSGTAADKQAILNQALYDAARAAGADAAELAVLGVGLGLFTEKQAEAALKAAALQVEIDRLGQLIAGGMGLYTALDLLDQFQEKMAREYQVKVDVSAALAKLSELQHSADVLAAKLAGAGGPTAEPTAGNGSTGGTPYDPGAGGGGNLPGPGGQHGLNFMVPPGFPNDTFPLRASSGERVIIQTPGQQAAGNGGGLVIENINVQAAPGMDTEQLAEAMIRKLGGATRGRLNSRAIGSRL